MNQQIILGRNKRSQKNPAKTLPEKQRNRAPPAPQVPSHPRPWQLLRPHLPHRLSTSYQLALGSLGNLGKNRLDDTWRSTLPYVTQQILGCLGDMLGMRNTTQLYGDYNLNHDKDPYETTSALRISLT